METSRNCVVPAGGIHMPVNSAVIYEVAALHSGSGQPSAVHSLLAASM